MQDLSDSGSFGFSVFQMQIPSGVAIGGAQDQCGRQMQVAAAACKISGSNDVQGKAGFFPFGCLQRQRVTCQRVIFQPFFADAQRYFVVVCFQ